MLKRIVHIGRRLSAESKATNTSKLSAFRLAQEQCVGASWNGFPWLSSCIQTLHHQVQCKALDAVV